jgi:NAD-dependent SIR2 family protein deacetylase
MCESMDGVTTAVVVAARRVVEAHGSLSNCNCPPHCFELQSLEARLKPC